MGSYERSPSLAERPGRSPSPRPQTNIQDDVAMPGFGIEFEHCFKRAWEDREDKERGRLAKYSRFGMTEEDARRATPEHMREAYDTLVVDQLADVYTPSPSPSIPPTPTSKDFDQPGVLAPYSPNWSLEQHQESIPSQPTVKQKGSSHGRIGHQSTPRSEILRPVSRKDRSSRERGKVVLSSKIAKKAHATKRIQVRKPVPSRHKMETRSRTMARVSGLG